MRRIHFGFALRIAAAVLLVASMGVLYVQQNNTADNAVASIPKKPIEQKATDTQNNATAQITAKQNSDEKKQAVANKPEPAGLIAAAPPVRNRKIKEAATSPKNPISTKETHVAEAAMAYEPVPVPRKSKPYLRPIEPDKKDFEPAVTYDAPQPYNTSDATAKAAFAVEKEDEGRNRGNLKSLLRKATRMVERRTGINATNEDEELLIGVVALKLK